MTPAHVIYLGLKVKIIDNDAQKIDGSSLPIYVMVISAFQAINKLSCS